MCDCHVGEKLSLIFIVPLSTQKLLVVERMLSESLIIEKLYEKLTFYHRHGNCGL